MPLIPHPCDREPHHVGKNTTLDLPTPPLPYPVAAALADLLLEIATELQEHYHAQNQRTCPDHRRQLLPSLGWLKDAAENHTVDLDPFLDPSWLALAAPPFPAAGNSALLHRPLTSHQIIRKQHHQIP